MTELEELKKQRKEIDEKIKALEDKNIYYGRARYSEDPRPGVSEFYHLVHVKIPVVRIHGGHVTYDKKYSSICRAETKADLMSELKYTIEDLRGLYDKLYEEL